MEKLIVTVLAKLYGCADPVAAARVALAPWAGRVPDWDNISDICGTLARIAKEDR